MVDMLQPDPNLPQQEDALVDAYMADIAEPDDIVPGVPEAEEEINTPREAMDDETLLALVENEINNAAGYWGGDLTEDREIAMRYYLGMPRGDELEGRSTVISMDVSDAIEWILPQVIRAFTANEDLVQFEPTGEEDEEQAQQESEYVSYVFYRQNSAYFFLYSFVKDALMQKNGISKTFWDDTTSTSTETYEGLNEAELVELMSPTDGTRVEPREYTAREEVVPQMVPTPEGLQYVEVPQQVHDIKLRRTRERGCATVSCVAPEQFLISREASDIDPAQARFTAHWEVMMASDLVEEGLDVDFVDTLPGFSGFDQTTERETRRFLEDERDDYDDNLHPSTRRIVVYECYVRADKDGDGIAELLKVRVAGPNGFAIIDWEEVDENPFGACTPFILSHKFFGLSLFDKLKQIQDQKTAIWRQILDNLYLQNNSRTAVVDGQVNLDDLMTNRPGGVVRQAAPGMIESLTVAPVGKDGYAMLEYLDKVRTERTGVSPEGASQAFPVGADTAHGIERLMTMKEELVALIIRTIGETGIKKIFQQLRTLLIKHQTKTEVVKLRGKWVEVSPSEWRHRYNTSISVVLGPGDKLARKASVQEIGAMQEKVVANGGLGVLVTHQNLYNTAADYVRLSELGDADRYFQNPSSDEGKAALQQAQEAAQEPTEVEKALAIQEESKQQVASMKAQVDMLKQQLSTLSERLKLNWEREKFYATQKFNYDKLEAEEQVDVPGEGSSG